MALTEFIYRTVYEATGIEAYARAAHVANKSLDELSRRATKSEEAVAKATKKTSKIQEEATEKVKKFPKDAGKALNEIAATGFRLTFYAISAIAAGQALLQTVIVRGMAQAAAEFEREMDRIADAAELSQERMNALGVAILDFSNKVSANATRVARFFGTAMVLGFSEEQTKAMAAVVKKLSLAIAEDFDKSGDALVRLLSLWGMAADQAPILAARLAYMADRTGQSIVQDLLPVLEDAILLVPQVPQEQMMALLTVAGRFGKDVAQQLPRFLSSVVRAFAKEGAPIPTNIVDMLLRLPAEKVLQVFGPRMARFLNFMRQNKALYGEIFDRMRKLGEVEAATSDLAARAEQNAMMLSVALEELGGVAKTVWTSFGVGALPLFTTFVHALKSLVALIGALPGPIKVLGASFFTLGSTIAFVLGGSLAVAGVLGAVVNRIGDFVQKLENPKKTFESWSNFFKGLKEIELKGNLGAAMTGLKGIWGIAKEAFRAFAPLLTLISLIVFVMSQYADSEFFRRFPWLYKIIQLTRGALQHILEPIKQMLLYTEKVAEILGKFAEVTGLKAVFEGMAAGIFTGLMAPLLVVTKVLEGMVALVELLIQGFKELSKWVKSVVDALDRVSGGWASRIIDAIGGIAGGILNAIGAIVGVGLGIRFFGWLFRGSGKPLGAVGKLLGFALTPIVKLFGSALRFLFQGDFSKYLLERVGPVARGRFPHVRWFGRLFAEMPSAARDFLKEGWGKSRFWAQNPGRFMRTLKGWSWGEFLKQLGRMAVFAPGKIPSFLGNLSHYAVVQKELKRWGVHAGSWFEQLGRKVLQRIARPTGIVAPGFGFGGGAVAAGGRGLLSLLRRVPLAAPLSVLWDLLTGVSLPRAIGGGVGTAIGGILSSILGRALVGAIGGPWGALAGFLVSMAGSLGGYLLGSAAGGLFEGQKTQEEQLEHLADMSGLLQGPIPVRVVNLGDVARPVTISMTVQTAPGTTSEQAEEIARKVVAIFSRAQEVAEMENRERALVTMSPYRR